MRYRQSSFWLPYLVACLTILASSIGGALLMQPFGSAVLFAAFFAAVAASGWYGGFGPALLATVLSYLVSYLFFIPAGTFFLFSSTSAAFAFVCLAIALSSEAMRRARQRAQASADQVARIVESISDGFISLDGQGRLTYTNRAAMEINHRYRQEGLAQSALDFFPLLVDNVAAQLRGISARNSSVDFEFFFEPWKQWFEVKASAVKNNGLAVYFRDITDRKRAEAELKQLASIVESSEDAVIGRDLVGNITSWNDAAEKLYGYTPAEALGQSVSMLIPPDRTNEEVEIVARIVQGQGVRHYDTQRVAKNGRLIHVSLSVSPIKDGNGNVIGASKIARDITERKRAEAALVEADKRKDDFLALLGHELRNPLAGIVNGVQVLKRISPPEEDAVEIREIIERQADQMRHLIDDLLDVARIARGKVKLRTEKLDLAALARRTAEDQRQLFDQRDITLDLQISSEPLWIEGDAVRLSQVLGNLLNNSAKFTNQGGRVTVQAYAEPAEQQAALVVSDTGIGLKSGAIASIFEPFSQADQTLGRSQGGLGLGLALVKGLIELHRGTVEAASEGTGRGATFAIRLPLAEAPAPSGPKLESSNNQQPPCRVLIIDDCADGSLSLSKLLNLAGHTTMTAADGPTGIEMARQSQPDVVLCDISLNDDMNGYDVAEALRAHPDTKDVHLVAITGFGQESDRSRARQAGFDKHMTKPVNHVDLLATIAEVTGARAQ